MQLDNIIEKPLQFAPPCHYLAVERRMKLVSEASSSVVVHQRRDGLNLTKSAITTIDAWILHKKTISNTSVRGVS